MAMQALHAEMHSGRSALPLPISFDLQIRLRATADQLVSESSEDKRNEVLLGCRAYLELVLRSADAGDLLIDPAAGGASSDEAVLGRLQQRSERYLQLVAGSTGRIVTYGSDLLGSLLRRGAGARSGMRRNTATCTSFTGSLGGTGATTTSSLAPTEASSAAGEPLAVGCCVLTHGYSRHVAALLLRVAEQAHFTLVVAEGRPDGDGHRTARELLQAGVPVRMIEPGAVARCMAQCRLVLCGAHAVLSDGGVLAPLGTLNMAYAAQAHGRPLYVAAPHYAFSSTHHLDATAQTRARARPCRTTPGVLLEEPRHDATPAHLITLLITDIGVLTPSAAAEEIMRRELG